MMLGRLAGVVSLVVFMGSSAGAHEPKATVVFLEIGADAVALEEIVPVDQLALARTKSFDTESVTYVRDHREELTAYARDALRVLTPAGQPFAVTVESTAIEHIDDGDCWVMRARLTPPAGASTRSFRFGDRMVFDEVVNHRVLVFLRSDIWAGVLDDDPELLGVLGFQRSEFPIDRGQGSWHAAFLALVRLGAAHVAEGTDHLLFLLMVLLPAPIMVATDRKRWTSTRTAHPLRRILVLITTFTLGHSATLALATLGIARLPTRPVEVAIAVSILVSAIHAIRPIFPGREAWLTGGFGLVHGLAFGSVLSAMGAHGSALVVTLLGFNLGIELMQCAYVVAVLPVLWLVLRTSHYTWFRLGGAIVGVIAALYWIVERA